MKQTGKQILKGLRYGAILAVLLLGLVSIIGTGSSSTHAPPPGPEVREGVFQASAVEGLYYDAQPSGRSGYTDEDGTFQYVPGDTVAFYLGGPDGLELGAAPGAAVIRPGDIEDEDDFARLITLILYALDVDNDPTNGVTLPGQDFPGDLEDLQEALADFDAAVTIALAEGDFDALRIAINNFREALDNADVEVGMATIPDPIETDSGAIVGYEVPTRMKVWKGIPFAGAPVGDLRFAAPTDYFYDDIVFATQFSDMCVQDDGSGSEDCLYLNIFAPTEAENNDGIVYADGSPPSSGLPVMVWIHGGAFIQGSACNPGYDMPDLVNEDVIVVTINYRLNAFGFLPHPALEDPTGNFGLKDQVAALKWVKENIAAFGGNPNNVTIFGESAGGHSVLSLMAADPQIVDRLFHQAIVQSGSYSPEQTPLIAGPGEASGYAYLGYPYANVGGVESPGPCGGTDEAGEIRACLRDLSVEEIMNTQSAAPGWAWFTPVYQAGTFLPQSIEDALDSGEIADVPVMIGSNLHEGTLFAAMFLGDFNLMREESDYYDGVRALLNPTGAEGGDIFADAVGAYYLDVAPEGDNLYRNVYSMIWTDAVFALDNLGQWVDLATAEVPTYAYWFTDEDTPINPTYAALGFYSDKMDFGTYGLGASHSFEIQYIFGTLQDQPFATTEQKALSDRMINYWANFAKDGEPGEAWTAVNLLTLNNIMKLHPDGDDMVSFGEFGTAHNVNFWSPPE